MVRVANVDDVIDGYSIPKGSVLVVAPGVIHRLPQYWGDDVDSFNPYRWLRDSTKKDNNESATPEIPLTGAFFPFANGTYNCIGQRFAAAELRVILAGLIRAFEFLPVENWVVKKSLRVTWQPNPYIKLKVKPVL